MRNDRGREGWIHGFLRSNVSNVGSVPSVHHSCSSFSPFSLPTYHALGEEISLEAGGSAKEGADSTLGVDIEGGHGKVLEGGNGRRVAGLGSVAGRLRVRVW